MSGLFKKPPKPKDIPIPDRTDQQVQNAADEQRKAVIGQSTTQSWLTGGMGAPKNSSMYAASKLLSGVQ